MDHSRAGGLCWRGRVPGIVERAAVGAGGSAGRQDPGPRGVGVGLPPELGRPRAGQHVPVGLSTGRQHARRRVRYDNCFGGKAAGRRDQQGHRKPTRTARRVRSQSRGPRRRARPRTRCSRAPAKPTRWWSVLTGTADLSGRCRARSANMSRPTRGLRWWSSRPAADAEGLSNLPLETGANPTSQRRPSVDEPATRIGAAHVEPEPVVRFSACGQVPHEANGRTGAKLQIRIGGCCLGGYARPAGRCS